MWYKSKDIMPKKGLFILVYRNEYPSFYWMGFYDPKSLEQEDEFEYWIQLPTGPGIDREDPPEAMLQR